MSKNLLHPDLVMKDRAVRPTLEIAIDHLPDELQARWLPAIHRYTRHYVQEKYLSGSATIWNWCEMSANFAATGKLPGRSMFHVVFGLPEDFLSGLEAYLADCLGSAHVGIKEYKQVNWDDGWMAVCHVEQGKAWRKVDAFEWEEISVPRPVVTDTAAQQAAAKSSERDVQTSSRFGFVLDSREEDDPSLLEAPRTPTGPRSERADDEDLVCDVRAVFADGKHRSREDAIRELARVRGYQRVGPSIRDQMNSALLAAVRRGTLVNSSEGLALGGRSIRDYDKPNLEKQFLASMTGRAWKDQDAAVLDFARWLGFARTGSVITETAELVIRSLIRQGRLERDRRSIRRAP